LTLRWATPAKRVSDARRGLCHVAVVLLAGLGAMASAEEAKPPPQKTAAAKPAPAPATAADDEFLEFLGSVDSDGADGDWLEFLGQTEVGKGSKAKDTPRATEVKK
jgi:hypothetical protein